MKNILNNFVKILFGGGFIIGGMSLPMVMSTGHFLECQRNDNEKATKNISTANCEILEMRGGTLLSKGNQVLNRYLYRNIRSAEVATVKGDSISSGRRSPDERIVLVFAKGKQAVDARLNPGMAANVSKQINDSIADPEAQKFSVDIGQAPLMPQVIGWVLVAGGVLVFFTKPS